MAVPPTTTILQDNWLSETPTIIPRNTFSIIPNVLAAIPQTYATKHYYIYYNVLSCYSKLRLFTPEIYPPHLLDAASMPV